MLDDTIAAIATAPGEAGIGIVRLSGKDAINILDQIFRPKSGKTTKDIESRFATYGYVIDKKDQIIDEALAIIMRKPYSYTTEDVVEIQCHGGIVPVRKIMELVLKNGAVLAEPGEFTKRAFLNGRIDLAQAEAVIDVITAKTETGLNAALNQLEGELSKEIHQIMDQLVSILAHIEASIDFPEHDIEELTSENIKKETTCALIKVEELVNSFHEGRIIRDGLSTAIIGRPNVGKSSLLNVLLKESRAIVTDIPGTTRDIIEEYLNIAGILLKLVDTAGIRETEDVVERIGVERTRKAIDESELVLFVVDMSRPLASDDMEIINLLENKKVVVAANKMDLGNQFEKELLVKKFGKENIIEMSAKNGYGIKQLEDKIRDMIYHGETAIKRNNMVTSIRHKDLLEKAQMALARVLEALENGIPVDLLSVDIKEAWIRLGQITGDSIEEDIVTEIFSKFCVGK